MQRRNFLQWTALAGVAVSVPAGLRQARAASGSGTGLFVFVQATGGWDPRMVCDPIIDPAQARAYTAAGRIGGIEFAPLQLNERSTGLSRASVDELVAPTQFFRTHGSRLLAVNGIDVGTCDHDTGTCAWWWGDGDERRVAAALLDREDEFDASPRFEDPELADLDRLLRHTHVALDGYEAGRVDAVHLELGGFDTHGSHDRAQARQLGKLYRGIDELFREVDRRGLRDRVTLVVSSEFGRAPTYDGRGPYAGKDHWPVTSALVAGPGLDGGRTIGATTRDLLPRPVLGHPLTPDRVLGLR